VLKGRHTVVAAPQDRPYVCDLGNCNLATAGSGDVLTGIIGALLCNHSPVPAAAAGVFLHAAAADQWRDHHGADRGMIASDIIGLIPQVISWAQARVSCAE